MLAAISKSTARTSNPSGAGRKFAVLTYILFIQSHWPLKFFLPVREPFCAGRVLRIRRDRDLPRCPDPSKAISPHARDFLHPPREREVVGFRQGLTTATPKGSPCLTAAKKGPAMDGNEGGIAAPKSKRTGIQAGDREGSRRPKISPKSIASSAGGAAATFPPGCRRTKSGCAARSRTPSMTSSPRTRGWRSNSSRSARRSGREGRTRKRLRLGVSAGAWGEMEGSVNALIDDLLWPTTAVTHAITAVAQGDLQQTVPLDVDGTSACRENSCARRKSSMR